MVPLKPIALLLVEDNEGDVGLVRHSMSVCERPFELTVVRDGEEALRVLSGFDCLPDLVILDLNIPKLSGLTVLERLNPHKTPVVVFSSSCSADEMRRASALG